jgi:hypothetical protein
MVCPDRGFVSILQGNGDPRFWLLSRFPANKNPLSGRPVARQMLNKIFPRQSRLDHPDPAQRLQGIAELPAESDDLTRVLASDPAPAVRAAAARQSNNAEVLAGALELEADPAVRHALLEALAAVAPPAQLQEMLGSDRMGDADRGARRPACRDRPVTGKRDRGNAERRIPGRSSRSTRNSPRREWQRRNASMRRTLCRSLPIRPATRTTAWRAWLASASMRSGTGATQGSEADAILTQLEALAVEPGPILTAVVELNRRWQALDLRGDTERLARCEAARQVIQDRFDREQEEQRSRAAFERRVRDWIAALVASPPATVETLIEARAMLQELRGEAARTADRTMPAKLDEAEQRIVGWERAHEALAGAEALVLEAEKLAADTSIDNAGLPARWQALDRSTRTPELTRRFEAALMTVEQRRLAQIQATQQEATALRLRLHTLLHTAEQALASGQLHAARAATDEIRTIKSAAGVLPKPTIQRLSRAVQQLVDLERWESFGQHNARGPVVRARRGAGNSECRLHDAGAGSAEAAQRVEGARRTALRRTQGVVGSLRSRLRARLCAGRQALRRNGDAAQGCAQAPRGLHCDGRRARADAGHRRRPTIAQSSAGCAKPITHGARAIWGAWIQGSWKKFDAKLKEAIAPARDALGAARDRAKAGRQALIDEVRALSAKAMERDIPSQVKAIQLRWQEQAKSMPIAQRDERALWDQFRAACDAVFDARQAKRKEEDSKKSEHRRALEDVSAQLEALARGSDKSDQDLKRALREAQDQWKKLAITSDAAARDAVRDVEPRFRKARTAVESALTGRARSREAASWQVLAAKELLCESLDRAVLPGTDANAAQSAMNDVQERWAAQPELPAAQEKKMAARRDAAVVALTDSGKTAKHAAAIAANAEPRREMLLELELVLGLDSPPALQSQRLALQVKQLKDRFKSAVTVTVDNACERLLAWCAMAGVCDAADRPRVERIFAKCARSAS